MVYVDQLPAVGATIMGQRYEEHPGGKGSNQAVAASLWGTQTQFVGCLGEDEAGTILREAMLSAGVNLDLLQTHPIGSGLALDFVDQSGRYQAVVISRANQYVTSDFLKPDPAFWKDIGLLVQQLEIPFETVDAVGRMALNFDVPVLLNAAPAANIPKSWWDWINMLVVNEVEASALTGLEIQNPQDAEIAAQQLHKHCPNVLITLGEKGVLLSNAEVVDHLQASKVPVVSTLGAGDAFVGVFAAEWVRHQDLWQAAELANRAAAASVQRSGAQVSYLRREEFKNWGLA
ncbi:MAG: ribokinase [Deltaproteobacteria bacterium]|jgi:ribokinase|nr:ribokinase [Deltaproteobacteria bacterium]